MTRLRVAAAQYPVEPVGSWAAYREKQAWWVREARALGADLAVFPEYASLELASLLPDRDLRGQLEGLQVFWEGYCELFAHLARATGLHLVAGTFPVREGGGFRNRALWCRPDGAWETRDKVVMTRFERERWGVSGGGPLGPVQTPWGPVGIAVCYDSEFPVLVRRLAEAGARLVVVPACTDTLAGHHRVRVACRARALENQCFVVHAPTVGEAAWSEAVDRNVGWAGVYGMPEGDDRPDGVWAEGELNRPGWVTADLDLGLVDGWRADGPTLNFRDWSEQWPSTP